MRARRRDQCGQNRAARGLLFLGLLVSYSASSVSMASRRPHMRPRSPRHRRRGREESPHRSCAYRVRRVRKKVRIQATRTRPRPRRAPPPRPTTGARPLDSCRSRRRRGAPSAYLSVRGCHSAVSWSAGAPQVQPRFASLMQKFQMQESRRRARVGSSALLLGGSDESGRSREWAETSEIRELCR